VRTERSIAAGVMPICPSTGRVLLVRRGLHQSHPGKWATFGGKFEEEDQNPKETAKREFKEESGYKGKYKIMKKPIDVYESNHLIFYTYVGIFDEEFKPNLEEAEEAMDYGWFYLHQIPESLVPGFEETISNNMDELTSIILSNK
jgi:8-oxo-dGTP pyrophosphatase MutT (NUDIX family)